jgi:hypothetical protein
MSTQALICELHDLYHTAYLAIQCGNLDVPTGYNACIWSQDTDNRIMNIVDGSL